MNPFAGIIQKFFSGGEKTSGSVASERLRSVLVHDRVDVSPQCMDAIRSDMIKVISNYMDIDEQEMQIDLATTNSSVSLIANIPVHRVKRAAKAMAGNKFGLVR